MMETLSREAWIVEFFPAVRLIPQKFPKMEERHGHRQAIGILSYFSAI